MIELSLKSYKTMYLRVVNEQIKRIGRIYCYQCLRWLRAI